MALKNLRSSAMVSLSAAWVDPKCDRKRIASTAELSGLLPGLERAHSAVLNTRPSEAPGEAPAAGAEGLAAADALHDRKLRGCFQVLTGLAQLADDPAEARALIDARDALFPEGLKAVQASYVEEEGAVMQAENRLDAKTIALLEQTQLPAGKTLYDHVHAWFGAGKAVGRLSAARAEAEARAASAPGRVTQADVAAARNQWVRVVNLFLATLDAHPELDADLIARLRGPLDRANAKTERRAAPPKAGDDEAPDDDGTIGGRTGRPG